LSCAAGASEGSNFAGSRDETGSARFRGTLKEDEITEQNLGSVARFLHAKYNGGGVRSD